MQTFPPKGIETIFQKELIAAIPFGQFWINERIASEVFGVSRTVIREILFKFYQNMLVYKNDKSHWMVGPLTAKMLNDQYSMRLALEPFTLKISAQNLSQEHLSELLKQTRALIAAPSKNAEDIMKLEHAFHTEIHSGIANKMLLNTLSRAQTPIMIYRIFLELVSTETANQGLNEHEIVLELLQHGSIDAACEALKAHINAGADRMRQRLKTFSVLPRPTLPEYLKEV